MRIDQLTIRNFKGFEHRTFDFPRAPKGSKRGGSFHLLVGENGSGKSSTLDALAVAVGIWHVARPTAGWRAIRPGEARWQPIRHGDRMSFEPMSDPAIEAKGLIGNRQVGWTRTNRGNSSKTSNSAAMEALAEVNALLGRSREAGVDVTLPVLAHYGAGRAWLPQKDRVKGFPMNMKKGSRLDAYYYCLDGRIRDKELNQWFLYELLETSQRGRKRDGLTAVETAVLNCLPGALGLRFDTDRREIVLKMEGGQEMPFYNLSDGQRATLALVADIAIKAVTLNPHLGRNAALRSPGIVMIDELDLHLHPKWQRRIIDDLKRSFPELQFICSSHSPFLIQSLKQGELIVLQGEATDGVQVGEYANQSLEAIVEEVQGVEMPQRNHRAEVVSQAVEKYIKEIKSPGATRKMLKQAEQEYREVTEPYAPNPGLNALLKLEAMAATRK
jgi:predicted ATP-binding protein involved in virulence